MVKMDEMREKRRKFSIEKLTSETDVLVLVSGRLDMKASAVLGPECAKLFEADYRVTIDLAKVSSVDSMGIHVLNALGSLGATLRNVPAAIAQKIEPAKHKSPPWR